MTATTDAALEQLPTGPGVDGTDLPYWEGLRSGVLTLPRCRACGTWRSLGRVLCPQCWAFETDWEAVPARGRIFSWARSQRAFISELDVPVPYVTALVELVSAPVRVLGILLDASGDASGADPAIGDTVTGVIVQPANAEYPVLRWQSAAAS